jgi:hypothetical protein
LAPGWQLKKLERVGAHVRLGGEEPRRDPGEGGGGRSAEAEVDEQLGRVDGARQEDALDAATDGGDDRITYICMYTTSVLWSYIVCVYIYIYIYHISYVYDSSGANPTTFLN